MVNFLLFQATTNKKNSHPDFLSSDRKRRYKETEAGQKVLDINMPEMDGLELCKMIRQNVVCPILFLTARITEQDKINGLQSAFSATKASYPHFRK